jgi:hypothetical protein
MVLQLRQNELNHLEFLMDGLVFSSDDVFFFMSVLQELNSIYELNEVPPQEVIAILKLDENELAIFADALTSVKSSLENFSKSESPIFALTVMRKLSNSGIRSLSKLIPPIEAFIKSAHEGRTGDHIEALQGRVPERIDYPKAISIENAKRYQDQFETEFSKMFPELEFEVVISLNSTLEDTSPISVHYKIALSANIEGAKLHSLTKFFITESTEETNILAKGYLNGLIFDAIGNLR